MKQRLVAPNKEQPWVGLKEEKFQEDCAAKKSAHLVSFSLLALTEVSIGDL